MRSIYKNVYYEDITSSKDCAKIRGSCVIMGLVGLVPSRHRGYFVSPKFLLVGISWGQNFCSWVFRGPKKLSPGYFVGPNFFSWVFRGSKIFSRGYFVGPKLSLVGNFLIFSC